MNFINEKIRATTDNLRNAIVLETTPVSAQYIKCDGYKKDNTPPPPEADWKPLGNDKRFSGVDEHYWIHFSLKAKSGTVNTERRIRLVTGLEKRCDATSPQTTVFVNGKTWFSLDNYHCWFPLDWNTDYDIYFYMYTSLDATPFDMTISEETADLRTEALYYDIDVPYKCIKELGEESYESELIRNALNKATFLVDFRHVYSEDYYNSIAATSEYLKTEFYEKECGKSTHLVSGIGHTHIDVAWLWTVAQTREKAQRSFSTAINLMKRYDDYIFMSSQPQLYQYVKENDPELYAEIKKYAKEGRWEIEGAMWLEADTNLISGESLIRQILHGKKFMRDEFGVESKLLWLPDVFGYSAVLPQILKKSGVTQFFTTKLFWNETNPMPHDTFIWEGMDGSEVFASFASSYLSFMGPQHIMRSWNHYKDKKLNNNSIITFGYADGGGGTTIEMMENYKRLAYGIPGMPAVKIEKAGDYFNNIEANFRKNCEELRDCPRWIGEMYLEAHRGTYTSIAKNKKYNRKSELLYQEAEALSVTAMTLCDEKYPRETLEKNQINILLNQFHDIIPGSSIKEVYEDTDREYEIILSEGRKIADDRIKAIMSDIKTEGGIFVYNPSPFEASGFVSVNGQDVYADNIPAHGWKVISFAPCNSGIAVSEHSIENSMISVKFNEKYHIISVYDKIENREIIPTGTEANCLEIFEDYPHFCDAWEITNYYTHKKWIADDVTNVEILENGLRITRKYQQSEIIQDIVLNKDSKRIDFITKVDWHEDHVLMKAAFPVDINNTMATYDIQFGNIQRPTHKNTSWDEAKFEVSAHKWADLSEDGYGVSILNDCKYGYSIERNIMKISLLKAATYPNPEADRGTHEFTYSLYPHVGDFRQGETVQEGYKLNMSLEAYEIPAHDGTLPETYSLAESDRENVVIETIKKAEDDDSIIVRFFESYNQKSNVTITVGFDFKEVYLCDLMENNIQKLDFTGNSVTYNIRNFEIVTLKFVR